MDGTGPTNDTPDRPRTAALVALVAAAAGGAALGTPGQGVQVVALVLGVMLVGTPHGGLDHRLGRRLLAPRFGAGWPLAFLLGYLGAAGATVAVWLAWPALGLSVFLALSWAHFGDARARGAWRAVESFARGGAPLGVPALAHPDELRTIFAWLAGEEGAAVAAALGGPVAWLWATAALAHGARAALRREREGLELAAVVLAAAMLPPLLSFTLFFCLVHAPRALAESARAAGESVRQALRAAAPLSAAAGIAACVGYALLATRAPPEIAAVRTLFVWLAALTVPHMLLAGLARLAGAELTSPGAARVSAAPAAR